MAAEKDSPKTLAQKIAQIMIDLEPIEKNGRVSFGQTKYNYISADMLFATLQKKVARAGIIVIPQITDYGFSPDGKLLLGKMVIRVENTDNPNDYREIPWLASASTSDDKGPNKIGTSGEKYALMRLFMISDEEDPDAEVYVDPQLRSAVAAALEADKEAAKELAARLGKGADEMTTEELEKTLAWLRKRAEKAS